MNNSALNNRNNVPKDSESTPKNILGDRHEAFILREIISTINNPLLITNKDFKIVYANPAWENLTGYKLHNVINRDPKFLSSGKTPKRIYSKMWRVLEKGKSFSSSEFINKRKNNSEYKLKSDIYPITLNKKVVYYVQIQHDITNVQQLEEMRKEFLYVAAHELKTPIAVLKLISSSHLNRARKTGKDSIKLNELELVDHEIDRLTQLINDILDSSRFETGKQFLMYEKVNLVNLIYSSIEKVKIYSPEFEFNFKYSSKSLYILADSIRIEQVMLNLLSNAVKYSPNSRLVTITASKVSGRAIVSVVDNGIGIEPSKQKYIFDKYYQVKSKSKTGFGLGLYISNEIIKRHKGKLWVKSVPGKGTSFYFSLPLYHDILNE